MKCWEMGPWRGDLIMQVVPHEYINAIREWAGYLRSGTPFYILSILFAAARVYKKLLLWTRNSWKYREVDVKDWQKQKFI